MTQLREHTKFTVINHLRKIKQGYKLGKLGKNVYIERNVRFLRFPKNIFIDDEVMIKDGVRICSCNSNAMIRVGKKTTIGYHTFIFASNSIKIGNDCLIAPFVYIVDSNHKTRRDKLINSQINEVDPIVIEDDVWIASNVTILKGITIKKGAVIAANSVVTKDVPSYEIWGGTPAKKINERK